MLSGKVDATLGAFWNIEGVELERRNRKPEILHLEDLGVPTYDELVIVAREETVRHDGAMIRRFMQALAKATGTLADRPDAGLDPLIAANPDLDRPIQEAQLKATLPVLQPEGGQALRLDGAGRVGRVRQVDGAAGAARERRHRPALADERVPPGPGHLGH